MLLLDDDAHREQRRLLMPPFRGNHLTTYADTMAAVARAEIAGWPRGEPVALYPRLQELTLEIILHTVFGLSDGARLNQLRAELLRSTMTATAAAGRVMLILAPRRAAAALIRRHFRVFDSLLYAEIGERRQVDDLAERADVLSILLRARHIDGRPMRDVEIRDELMTLLTAGHDTTAAALAWAVERLGRDPDWPARLTAEIQAGDHDFVDAVVKETLRLRPVVSVVARRLKAPMEVGGVPLPAGVTVVPSIYLMHRRRDVYSDPEEFRPERFLEQRIGAYTWIPFGGGVRRCLGAAFAESEMRIVLGALFGAGTVRPADERAEPMRRRGITHVPGRGATVVLE